MHSSHPTRVRGLKHRSKLEAVVSRGVAPHAGAWIETRLPVPGRRKAPVAPHAGAWIETRKAASSSRPQPSHPTRVRGLKPEYALWLYRPLCRSHPTRVRGLKPHTPGPPAPAAGSHPTRVRGLKLPVPAGGAFRRVVAPHAAAWIETFYQPERTLVCVVAPHAGAWIETPALPAIQTGTAESHPTRVRGLKHHGTKSWSDQTAGRTPRGCVD